MSTKDTSGQETDGTDRQAAHRNDLAAAASEKTLKRARWEALALGACAREHRVNVVNESYGDDASEHTYTVTIGPDGLPTECTCPADEYQPGPCKHAVACADDHEAIADAMHGDAPERADADEREPLGPDTTTMADLLRADGRLVATDGGQPDDTGADTHTDAGIEATQPDGEPSDADYCAKYIVPVSECVLADGEGCPHGTITGDTGANTDGRIDTGQETCARCPKPLNECHAEPAGYTVVTTDGEELCPECADARCGEEIGFGTCDRDVCPHCGDDEENSDETDASDDSEPITCMACGAAFDSFLDCARHERGGECDDTDDTDDTPDTEGYERPTRSEPADFGGGEGGIDEL